MKNVWAFIEAYLNAYHVIDKLYGSHKIMHVQMISPNTLYRPGSLMICNGI